MPLYTFVCRICQHEFDEFIRLSEFRKTFPCPNCGEVADKIISLPNTHKDLAYNFVDTNTTGKPVQITSKGQWKRHLKSLGLTDDIPQSAPKMNELKQLKSEKPKSERVAEHKKVIEGVLREEGKIR